MSGVEPLPALPEQPTQDPIAAQRLADYERARERARAEAFQLPPQPTPEEQDQQLVAQFGSLYDTDPATAAEVRQLAKARGQDPLALLKDPVALKQLQAEQALVNRELHRNNPTLARWLSAQEWAITARDDIESLVEHDGIFSRWADAYESSWWQKAQSDIGLEVRDQGLDNLTPAQARRYMALEDKVARARERAPWMFPLLNTAGQLTRNAPVAFGSSWLAAQSVFAMSGNPVAAGSAGIIGGFAAMFGQVTHESAGRQYAALLLKGVQRDIAWREAVGYAVVEGLLEAVGGTVVQAPVRAMMRDTMLRTLGRSLERPSMQQAWKQAAWMWGESVSAELATELPQTAAEYISTLRAIATLPEAQQAAELAKIQPLAQQLADTFVDTLLAMGPLGAFAPAVRLHSQMREVRRSQRDLRGWDELTEARTRSRTAGRPEVYESHLQHQVTERGLPNVVLADGLQLRQVLRNLDQAEVSGAAEATGLPIEQIEAGPVSRRFAEQWPEQWAQMQREDPGYVEFPTAAYGARIVGTPLHVQLRQHIKFNPRGFTAAESQALSGAQQDMVTRARDQMAAMAEQRDQWEREHDEIVAEVSNALEASRVRGMDADAARLSAQLVGAFAVTAAQDSGTTPAQWWEQNRFTVTGERGNPQAFAEVQAQASGQQVINMQPELDPQTGERWQSLTDLFDHFNADEDFGRAAVEEVIGEQFGEQVLAGLRDGTLSAEDVARMSSPSMLEDTAARVGAAVRALEQEDLGVQAELSGEPRGDVRLEQPQTVMIPSNVEPAAEQRANLSRIQTPSLEWALRPEKDSVAQLERNIALIRSGKAKVKVTTKGPDGKKITREVEVNTYTSLRHDPKLTPQQQAESYVDQVTLNLLSILRMLPDDVISRSRLWYVGANRIARGLAARYGVTLEQAAAALAVTSPQADWRQNVSYVERICDILTKRTNHAWDSEMSKWGDEYFLGAEANKKIRATREEETAKQKELAKAIERGEAALARVTETFTQADAAWRAARDDSAAFAQAKAAIREAKKAHADMERRWKEQRTKPDPENEVTVAVAVAARDAVKEAERALAQLERNVAKLKDTKLAASKKVTLARKALRDNQTKLEESQSRYRKADLDQRTYLTVRDKRIVELEDDVQRAFWVRVFDEAHNERSFREILPEGEFGDWVRSDNNPNNLDSIGWKSFSPIAKAISVLRDGSAPNINEQLGGEHKVRSFYNNIYDPDSDIPFFTSDTHQVAASLVLPLGAAAPEVSHNFGTGAGVGNVGSIGLYGTYWIYQEAAQRAAKQFALDRPQWQLKVREVQSITWEAIRSIYSPNFKADNGKVQMVRDIWLDYQNGNATHADTFKRAVEADGGIRPPTWYTTRPGDGSPVENGGATYQSRLVADGPGTRLADAFAGEPGDRGAGGSAVRPEVGTPEADAPASRSAGLTAAQVKALDGSDGVVTSSKDAAKSEVALFARPGKPIDDAPLLSSFDLAVLPEEEQDAIDVLRKHGLRVVTFKKGHRPDVLSRVPSLLTQLRPVRLLQGWYSPLARALEVGPERATPQQWRELLNSLQNKGAVKPVEIETVAVREWIDYQESRGVTRIDREGLAKWVRDMSPQLFTTTYGAEQTFPQDDERPGPVALPSAADALAKAWPDLERALSEAAAKQGKALRPNFRKAVDDLVQALRAPMAASTRTDPINVRRERALERALLTYTNLSMQMQIDAGVSQERAELMLADTLGVDAARWLRSPFAPGNASRIFGGDWNDLWEQPPFDPDHRTPRWAGYSLNTSTRLDYGEWVLELPTEDVDQDSSEHWAGHRNVVVHLRGGVYTGDDGKRTFWIEEVQSDWAQEGLREGFVGEREDNRKELARLNDEIQVLQQIGALIAQHASDRKAEQHIKVWRKTMPEFVEAVESAFRLALAGDQESLETLAMRMQKAKTRQMRLHERFARMEAWTIPTHPLVVRNELAQTLALRKAVMLAAQSGCDSIAITSGAQQVWKNWDEPATKIEAKVEGDLYVVEFTDGPTNERVRMTTRKEPHPDDPDTFLWEGPDTTGWRYILDNMDPDEMARRGDVHTFDDQYEERIRIYDQQLPKLLEKVLAKTGGEWTERAMVHDDTAFGEVVTQRVFTLTDKAKEKARAGMPLFQGGARGEFIPRLMHILLYRPADLSTFLHETGHWYAEAVIAAARAPNATPEAIARAQALLRWLGIESVEEWDNLPADRLVAAHERIAYSLEMYLATAQAPSLEMVEPFRAYRQWITRVYQGQVVQGLSATYRQQTGHDLPGLTGEVTQLFNSMLANDRQIAEAAAVRELMPLYETQAESGMTDEAWRAYQDRIRAAEASARERLDAASYQEMQYLSDARSQILQDLQRQHARERAGIERRVRAELLQQPFWSAMQWLRTGRLSQDPNDEHRDEAHQIDASMAEAALGAESWAQLEQRFGVGRGTPFRRRDGISPDDVAEAFGVEGGGLSLLRQMLGRPDFDAAVRTETDRRMLAEHGELVDPARREELVTRALHSEARARMIGLEIEALESATRMQAPAASRTVAGAVSAADNRVQLLEQEMATLRAGIRTAEEAAATDPARGALLVQREGLRSELRAARAAQDDARVQQLTDERAALAQQLAAMESPELAQMRARLRTAEADLRDARRVAVGNGPVSRLMVEAARQAAQEAVLGLPYGQLRTLLARSDAAEIRHSRRAQNALRDDNLEEAVRAKHAQLRQHEWRRAAQERLAAIERDLRRIRVVFTPQDRIGRRRDQDIVAAARAILVEYGLATEAQSRRDWAEPLRRYNPNRYEDVRELIEEARRQGGNIRQLTVQQVQEVLDTVLGLWEESRRERILQIGEEQVPMAAAVEALVRDTSRVGPAERDRIRSATTTWESLRDWWSSIKAQLRRVEHWAQALGANWERFIYRPVQAAVDRYRIRSIAYTNRYAEMLRAIERDLPAITLHSDQLDYTFGVRNGGQGMTEVLGALLHCGNESNYRKLLLGYGWGEEREDGTLDDSNFREWLDELWDRGLLTQQHMDFVQATWDLIAELTPDTQAAHRQVFGYYFHEVTARPFEGQWGSLRGGYVPAKVDSTRPDLRVQRYETMAELAADVRQSVPQAPSGFRHERVEAYTRPLDLSLRMVARHLDTQIRFAELQPTLQQTLSLINRPDVERELARVDPRAREQMLIPWLNRVAHNSVAQPGRSRAFDGLVNGLRARVGVLAMFGNVSNAVQNITGIIPLATRVGPAALLRALWRVSTSMPGSTTTRIAQASPYMATRFGDGGRRARLAIEMIDEKRGIWTRFNRWSQMHAYFLQTGVQWVVDTIGWEAAYDSYMRSAPATVSHAEAHAAAVAHADSVIRTTQNATDPESIAAYEASTPFMRTLSMFSGYFNMMANLNATNTQRIWRQFGWRGVVSGRLGMSWLLGMGIPLFLADAIARAFAGQDLEDEDDDGILDELSAQFGLSIVRGAGAMVIGVGPIIQAAINAANDKPYDDRIVVSPVITALEGGIRGGAGVVRQVGEVLGLAEETDAFPNGTRVRDWFTLLGLLSGSPLAFAGRPAAYLTDVESGRKTPEGPIDFGRGVVTGR